MVRGVSARALVLGTALLFGSMTSAHAAPPAISQYVEQIPSASGKKPASETTATTPSSTAQQPARQSTTTQPAQEPSSTTTTRKHPPRTSTSPAKPAPSAVGAALSSDDSGGLGRGVVVALVLGAATLVAAAGLALRRRA